jgi:hypothetical protein
MFSTPITVLRETSPTVALDVVRNKRCFAGPILGDGGMNGVIANHPAGPYSPDQAADQGAILHFEWNGKIDSPQYSLHPPADILIDEHPHRAFFLAGTGQGLTAETGHLRLVMVTFKGKHGWHEVVGERPFFSFRRILMGSEKWKADQAQRIADEVAGVLASKPVIKVVLPSSCIYRSILAKEYPAIQ